MNKFMQIIMFMAIILSNQIWAFEYSQEQELEQELQYYQNLYPDRSKEGLLAELQTHFIRNMYSVISLGNLIVQLSNSDDIAVLDVVQQFKNML